MRLEEGILLEESVLCNHLQAMEAFHLEPLMETEIVIMDLILARTQIIRQNLGGELI